MGLFKREEHAAYPPEARGAMNSHPPRTSHSPKRGLFHKREEHAAYPPESRGAINGHPPRTSHSPKRGLFNRGSSPSSSSSNEGHGARRSPKGSHGGGLFHRRNREDPSVTAARQTLASAEDSERAAGRAAEQAKMAVADAKENVMRVEGQTKHESTLGKLKRAAGKDPVRR